MPFLVCQIWAFHRMHALMQVYLLNDVSTYSSICGIILIFASDSIVR